MLISLVTPSLEGVSQRSRYQGAILTSGYIHSVQWGHFWSLLATSYASFVTAFCLAAHSGRGPLCSSFYLPMLDGELSQLWRGSNLRSSDHRARTLPTTPPLERGWGLQNGKIPGSKLVVSHPQHRVKHFTPPF